MGREEIISVLNTSLSQLHESHRVITMQSNDNLEDNNSDTNHTILIEEKEYQNWVWGGKFRPVPEDFEFPTNQSSLKGVMDLYFAGIPAKRIRPFRLIKAATLHDKYRFVFCKGKFVYDSIIDYYLLIQNSNNVLT